MTPTALPAYKYRDKWKIKGCLKSSHFLATEYKWSMEYKSVQQSCKTELIVLTLDLRSSSFIDKQINIQYKVKTFINKMM